MHTAQGPYKDNTEAGFHVSAMHTVRKAQQATLNIILECSLLGTPAVGH